jgi:hypothetical protein
MYIGYTVFFAAFFFLANPFFYVGNIVRHVLFSMMLTVGATVVVWNQEIKWSLFPKSLLILSFLYTLAAIRLHVSTTEQDKEGFQYYMAMLSLYSVIASSFASFNFDARIMQRVLLITSTPCCIWLWMNFDLLTDWNQRYSFLLGSLSYDSYQLIALVMGINILSAAWEIDFKRPYRPVNLIAFCICFTGAYFMLRGLARGEAIAVLLALGFYFAPRFYTLALPFVFLGLVSISYSIDLPLLQRLRYIFDGDTSDRVFLLDLSINLLLDDPITVLFGGGLNYFQSYWSFPSGRFPHNFIIEALISGGIPLCLIYVQLYIYPVFSTLIMAWRMRLPWETRVCLSLAILFVVVALKSGTLLSSWGFGMFTCVFLAINDRVVSARNR